MKYTKEMNNMVSTKTVRLIFEEENQCPICKSKISPIFISATLNSPTSATIFNFCRSCYSPFISSYKVTHSSQSTNTVGYYDSTLVKSDPSTFQEYVFDDKIIGLSPQFNKIYNQALAAESSSLDEIAGLGFRKALEFLVKDFAIHQNPDSEEEIKKMALAKCINKYIDNTQIKTLAERSAWIGNDEAHYIRKQEDRDINDMKKFIQATVYFIGMILITEDAASMEPK